MALIAQAATLEARVPFIHFFDGFRISHEVNKIEQLTEDDVRAMIDMELVQRAPPPGASRPSGPMLRGTAQNPDVFFQAREACNPFYDAVPGIVQKTMDKFAKLAGRQYHLFDYVGAADAERVIVIMGSGLRRGRGDGRHADGRGREGRAGQGAPLSPLRRRRRSLAALPKSVKKIAVLDRTKEPGAAASRCIKT